MLSSIRDDGASITTSRTVLLNSDDVEQKRSEIREYLHNTFLLEEQLYETLIDDAAFYLRAESLRHPLVFYYGHTPAFFINKLSLASLIPQRVNPHFESIFAVGVDEMSWDDLNQANYHWPSIDEVREYRAIVLGLLEIGRASCRERV